MKAHKKTLIRQAGSAEAFIDSLPLVVNCCKYSAKTAAIQYVLTQNSRIRSPETQTSPDFGEFIGFPQRRDTWAIHRPKTLSRQKSRHFGEVEEWEKNGTWIAPPGSERMKNPAFAGFRRLADQQEMGHCDSAILFRRNPPNGRIRPQIGPKHGDSCLGANRR